MKLVKPVKKRLLWTALVAALIAYPCARLLAHVRLMHPSSGVPLRWSSPANVGIVINSAGSDDVTDGSHETAMRLAIQDWNAVTGTTATLVEDASPASQARTDYEANDIHLILFDENNASGYFPGGSPTVAITPVWFYSSGVIDDADVLFNGASFQFTTSGVGGRFDVQDVAAHELGHLLGLDHTLAAGATMFPYVSANGVLQRSLSQDEVEGLRDAYASASFGRITGTVVRASDGSPVAGAYVVARDAGGRTRASILSLTSGAFTLPGLDPGTYTVYARPFDSDVGEDNLGSWWTGRIDTDFQPALYGSTATITSTQTIALGTLQVGDDVTLDLDSASPVRAIVGQSQTVVLRGTGLFVGSDLAASDPDIDALLGVPVWFGSQAVVQVTVPAGEEPGHFDLQVTNAQGELAILPAALEITPPSPTVTAVAPGVGSVNGGDALTIGGTNFGAGARVVIGDRIYTDGVDATVVDATTITLTTAATVVGQHDVVVIDPSGVEGRDVDGFTALSAPAIGNVLPRAGDALGGTPVVIAGEGFLDGAAVRIDGIDQGSVTVESPTRLRFTTLGGPIGGPYQLEIENPDGAIATQLFAYVNQLDPAVTDVSPATGSTGGGTTLTITGTNFTPTMGVSFYADPAGSPVAADGVTYVDASTLEVVTPQHAAGMVGVLVEDTNDSGVFSEDAFTFTGGGGGGGGCYTVPFEAPRGPRAWLEGGWWLLLVLALLVLRSRRARVAAA